jgi:anti-sigma B factor antagonist
MPAADHLLVAVKDGAAFVRIEGRGTFKTSGSLKEFGNAMLQGGCRELVLDLAECQGMDSTFMGVIAGLCFRFGETNEVKLVMVNLSEKTGKLVKTLGLDQLVETHLVDDLPEIYCQLLDAYDDMEKADAAEITQKEQAQIMLDAHENLAKLSPSNQTRFKDVLQYLKEEVKRPAQ